MIHIPSTIASLYLPSVMVKQAVYYVIKKYTKSYPNWLNAL